MIILYSSKNFIGDKIVINLSMYYHFHIIVIDNVKIYKLLVFIILVTEVSINILSNMWFIKSQ